MLPTTLRAPSCGVLSQHYADDIVECLAKSARLIEGRLTTWLAQPLKRRDDVSWKCRQRELQLVVNTATDKRMNTSKYGILGESKREIKIYRNGKQQ